MSRLKRFSLTENKSHNMSVCTETNTEQSYQSPSFALAIPIPSAKKYFIGVMKVNKLKNNDQLPKFEEHEIQFYRVRFESCFWYLGFILDCKQISRCSLVIMFKILFSVFYM